MVAFGAHQITCPKSWHHYLPPWVERRLPVGRNEAFLLHGAGNVSLGLLLISGLFPRLTIRSAIWWWITVTPFAARADWRSGARDLGILGSLLSAQRLLNKERSK